MKKALLIVNFHSGMGKAKSALSEIIEALSQYDILSTVYITKNKAETVETAKNAAGNYDCLVAIGGDGTLSEVVNGVMQAEKNIPVGYFPLGSTNDLARSLNIPQKYMENAYNIARTQPRKYDIGRFNDKYFTYIAATGAFTKVSYATSQSLKNALGHLAYILEGMKSVSDIQKMRITGSTDNGGFDGDYLFCSISNSTSVAGIIHLDSGRVLFDDGMFELCLVTAPKNSPDMMELVGSLLQSDFDNNHISIKRITYAELTIPCAAGWTLDGEDGGGQTSVSFSVNSKKLLLYTGEDKKTGGF